jgi:leucyl aminopeptidase (aminopeptidase T)
MKRSTLPPVLPVLVALVVAAIPVSLAAGEPDHDAIAASLVNESVGVQPGEVVLINGNPDQLDMMAAVQVAVAKAGGQAILVMSIPQANKRAVMETPMEHLERTPTAGLLLNRIADVTINVGSVQSPRLFADVPEERLAALREAGAPLTAAFSNIRTRNVSLGQTGGVPTAAYAESLGAGYGEVSGIFWEAVAMPPAELAKRAGAVASKLTAGAEVHLTSAAGTDLKFAIADTPARINAGRVSDVAAPTGPRSVWLPAGEAYACAKKGSASGTLVVPFLNFRGVGIDNLKLTFAGGRLTGMTADSDAGMLQQYLDRTDEASKELSIVDFGLNPKSRTPAGSHVMSWEMGGMVTLSTGNNIWAGGDNHANGGLNLHVPGLTATVGGKTVVEDGKLKL